VYLERNLDQTTEMQAAVLFLHALDSNKTQPLSQRCLEHQQTKFKRVLMNLYSNWPFTNIQEQSLNII